MPLFYLDFSITNGIVLCVMCFLRFVPIRCPGLGPGGQVWYLLVLIPDLCLLSYFQSKIYHKQNDLDFIIVHFPFLAGDVPCSPS